jgi:capsular polysaccharide biosynthesis protein
LQVKLYVSRLTISQLNVEALDKDKHPLDMTWKKAYFRGFKFMKRELILQYFGYCPNSVLLLKLMLKEFMASLIRNRLRSIIELFICYEVTLSAPSSIGFPISIFNKQNNQQFWISRYAIVSGVQSFVYGPEIEWDRTRFSKDFCGFVWGVENHENFSVEKTIKSKVYDSKGLGLVDNLKLDTNLIQKQINFKTIEKCMVVNGLIVLKDGIIYYLNRDNCLEEISWPTNLPSDLFGSIRLIVGLPMLDIEIESAVLYGSSTSWFHFLVDVLPNLLHLSHKENSTKTMIIRNQLPTNIMAIINRLGFKSVVVMRDGQSLQVKKLEMITDLRTKSAEDIYSREIDVISVREFLASDIEPSTDSPYVYIERDLQLFRPLLNGDQLKHSLLKLGFRVIRPEELDLEGQIRVFKGAKFVVAQSGAALTNIVFMAKGSHVLELAGRDNNNLFFKLSKMLGVNHKIIYGKSDNLINLSAGIGALKVDVKAVIQHIKSKV